MKDELTIVEAVPGDNFWSYGFVQGGSWVVEHRKLAGEKHHGKPTYGAERITEEGWNGIEPACQSLEAQGDQPHQRPRKSVCSRNAR